MAPVSIRLTAEQKKIVDDKAKELGLSRNAYILSKLFPSDDTAQSYTNIDDARRIENNIRAMVEQKYDQQHIQFSAGLNLVTRLLAENNYMINELLKNGPYGLLNAQFETDAEYQSYCDDCNSTIDQFKNNAITFADKNFPTQKED